jgi:hypothetical protein
MNVLQLISPQHRWLNNCEMITIEVDATASIRIANAEGYSWPGGDHAL